MPNNKPATDIDYYAIYKKYAHINPAFAYTPVNAQSAAEQHRVDLIMFDAWLNEADDLLLEGGIKSLYDYVQFLRRKIHG